MHATPTRLLILSDLWGNSQAEWWPLYTSKLAPYFDLKFYDSCRLAGISPSDDEAERHQQFIDGGIARAAKALITREQQHNPIILGFSIGGTIAWQACLNTLNATHLFAISATRLRKQTQKPPVKLHLIYGDKDTHRPAKDWHEDLGIAQQLINNADHELYRSPEIADAICQELIVLKNND